MTWLTRVPGLRDVVRESDEETLPRSNTLRIGDGLIAVYDTVTRSIRLEYDATFGADAASIRGEPVGDGAIAPEDGQFLGWNAILGEWEARTPPGSGDIAAPVDPTDDGKIGVASGGAFVYLAGAATGNGLRWQGTAWASAAFDATDPDSISDVGVGKFLQGAGTGNVAVDDVVANGDIGWFGSSPGQVAGGKTSLFGSQTTDGSTIVLPVFTSPDDCAFLIVVVVIAKEESSGDARIWELKRKFNSAGGTLAALSGSVTVSDDGDAGAAAWVATLQFDTQDVRVEATGEVGKTIEWVAIAQRIFRLV